MVNPLKITKEDGTSILRPEVIKLLKKGELPVKNWQYLIDEMIANYSATKKSVFKNWDFSLRVKNLNHNGSQWTIHHQDEGVTSFSVALPSGEIDGILSIECWATYRIPVNKSEGFKTHNDFNNTRVKFRLTADGSIIKLTTIDFRLGYKNRFLIQNDDFDIDEKGNWIEYFNIPEGYFK